MKLTQVLRGPPVFHFWKHFGAGNKRRYPYFKHWKNTWRTAIARQKVIDCTLTSDKLPAGSRIMQAEDFMEGHIDAMPDELIRAKEQSVVYSHPWPYNLKVDRISNQKPVYNYNINSRFFVPRDDCQVLTNTLIESDQLEAYPPVEPTNEHLDTLQRHIDWAKSGDSVLVRLPKKRSYPRIDQKPIARYGIHKERTEHNLLNYITSLSEMILSKHYAEISDQSKLDEISSRRSLAYPHCQVPFVRQSRDLNLDLFIDSMSLRQNPLPQINPRPLETRNREPVDIKPRSWRSTLEQTRHYTPNWSFTLPRNAYLHTIHLASRIKRDHRDPDEMLARAMLHAFGLTSQVARLKAFQVNDNKIDQSDDVSTTTTTTSAILLDPLSINQVNDRDVLEEPIVLQTIGYDDTMGSFHFMRYQLNSLKFNDDNSSRVKNQAWHSGPISDLNQALRFCLDFNSFDWSIAKRMTDEIEADQRRLSTDQSAG